MTLIAISLIHSFSIVYFYFRVLRCILLPHLFFHYHIYIDKMTVRILYSVRWCEALKRRMSLSYPESLFYLTLPLDGNLVPLQLNASAMLMNLSSSFAHYTYSPHYITLIIFYFFFLLLQVSLSVINDNMPIIMKISPSLDNDQVSK